MTEYFIKFGKHEHIVDLYENGSLYMNTVEYFSNIENVRKDKNEGLSYILQKEGLYFELNGHNITEALASPIRIYQEPYTHIFSCAAIYEGLPIRPDGLIFDKKLLEFGDALFLIPAELFLKRVSSVFERERITYN